MVSTKNCKKWLSLLCGLAVLITGHLTTDEWMAMADAADSGYRGYALVYPEMDWPMESFYEGYAAVLSSDGQAVTGFMNEDGDIVLTGSYDPTISVSLWDGTSRRTNRFYDGCALVRIEGIYHTLYTDGRLEKADTSLFTENRILQAVPEEDRYVFISPVTLLEGIMDEDKNVRVLPVWNDLTYISRDCILAQREIDGVTRAGIINDRGETVCEFSFTALTIACEAEGETPVLFAQLPPDATGAVRYRVLDTAGRDLLGRTVDAISCTLERPCVYLDGHWYLLDESGRLLTSARFDAPVGSGESLFPAKSDGLWGYVDEEGDWCIPPAYEEAESFTDGLAAVETAEGWGYIDQSGDYAVEPQYLTARRFRNGRAVVYTGRQPHSCDNYPVYDVAIIDSNGKVLQDDLSTIYPCHPAMSPSYHVKNYFQYQDSKGQYHLYDTNLEEVVISPYRITDVVPDHSNSNRPVFVVAQGDWRGLLNQEGRVLISPEEKLCSSIGFRWRGDGFASLNGDLIRFY